MRQIPLLFTLCFGLLTGCAAVQDRTTHGESNPGPSVHIPLEPYLREQAVIAASIGGHVGSFIFDTGEGISSISPEFAKKIGCKPWGRITGFRMSGERLDTPHCDNLRFMLADQQFLATAVSILDIMDLLGPDVPHVDGAIGLDVLAGHAITIVPRRELIVENEASLASRVAHANELPVRLVRDAEGLALAVDGAVPTPAGTAWFELDTGNGGANVVANHIAPLLGMPVEASTPFESRFSLANGIIVNGKIRTRDLIMDGNVGAEILNRWVLTLDLRNGRAWLAPFREDR